MAHVESHEQILSVAAQITGMNPPDQAVTNALLETALGAHRNGRHYDAESHYREILQQVPEHPAATHFLGIILFEKGDTDQGINLIVVADTLIYFGNLEKILQAAALALESNGLLIASVEELATAEARFTITPSGRYSHSRAYMKAVFKAAGFDFDSISPTDIRTEPGQPIKGLFVGASKHV